MVFVDRADLLVRGGDGGRGCAAFMTPRYARGPVADGGDGGDGGDVLLRADRNVATLLDFQYRHEFAGGRGGHGGSNTKTGRRGEDMIVRVPVGTVVQDTDTGEVLQDLTADGQQVIIARGGRGGLGNAARAQTVQARRREPQAGTEDEVGPGDPGQARRLRLELKLIADVGIIGCPNAGKSSLLTRLSPARPKVGAYPFTTRYPVLGVVDAPGRGPFVACDIPGLIEGAHTGKGLGMEFLRHIERTRVLVHVVDAAAVDGRDPVDAFRAVNAELDAYSPQLRLRPQVVAANKVDLPAARANLSRLAEAAGQPVVSISCVTGEGLPALRAAVADALAAAGAA